MEADPYCTIFLFINSASGGGMGAKLLSLQIDQLEFNIRVPSQPTHQQVRIYLVNLRSQTEKAFPIVKQYTDSKKKTLGIICGGDGSIMWVVSELKKYNIDPLRIPLGVLPVGTGNDFSQNLGWGKEKTQLVQNGFKSLKKMIRKWLVARQEEFDIWDVKATIFENGKFQKINKEGQNQIITDNEGQKSLTVSYSFCNYFSFGIDGKIGYSFDKRRTTSRVGNLIVYGAMGLIKAATKTKTIQELVEKMEIHHQLGNQAIEPEPQLQIPKANIKQPLMQKSNISIKKQQHPFIAAQNQTVFRSKVRQTAADCNQQASDNCLQSDYYNMLFLNINSFMGGVTDIWAKAKDTQLKTSKKDNYTDISTSDGKLEVISFSSSVGMALERVIGGFATRITQGEGPYLITFNRYQDIEKHRTYLQIDGEFIRFTHPKSVYITRSQLGNKGKIKVLRRRVQAQENIEN